MNTDIIKAAREILKVKSYDKQLYDFAFNEFEKKFSKLEEGWRRFDGYVILDENNMRIDYTYGISGYEYKHSFNICFSKAT